MKTVILGGGLTGITLARLLHEKGEVVTVLEREPDYGGLCRSMSDSGFTFDRGGSHIIFSRDEEVLKFMNDTLGENSQRNIRKTKIFYKGQHIKYPFENGLYQLPKDDLFSVSMNFSIPSLLLKKVNWNLPGIFVSGSSIPSGKALLTCT